MFLEPFFKGQRSGWVEVICGSMFSGKTEELLRRLRRAQLAGQEILICKPGTDTRYSAEKVVSHDDRGMDSVVLSHSSELLRIATHAQVIGIDEAQFFDMDLPDIVQKLALGGKRIVIAGLDMDFRGAPFGPMPALLAVSEYITKVHAICPHCGNLATHSYRITAAEEQVLLGAKEAYEPRCRLCFNMGNILDFRRQ
jgi:thymidine kinase